MILRIIRAEVHRDHHAEFERKLREIALPLVRAQAGVISVSIARPQPESPNEFATISVWKDEEAIKAFVGASYPGAVVPAGMAEHIACLSAHHYEIIE